MAAPSTTTRQNPSDFLKKITGRFVVVKLHNGSDYRGALKCLDGYMNIVLEQTEEYINGEFKRKYGDAFIRAPLTGDDGEDVSSFWFKCGCFSSCLGCSGCLSSCLLFSCLLSNCSPFVAAESKSSTSSGTSSSSEPLLSALTIRVTKSVTCFVSA